MRDLAAARAPGAARGDSLYESHYLTAVDPAGGRAIWLRHTALKRPGDAARPTVWLTAFDRAAPAPTAIRVTAAEPVIDPQAAWARSSLGDFGPGRARGAMTNELGAGSPPPTVQAAAWDLRWTAGGPELPYLPARWLYDRRRPRSGGVALLPWTAVTGRVTLSTAGTATPGVETQAELELERWDGMVGHNWGSEHAEQWTWLHAGGLGEDRRGWFDLILVRVRLGRWLTPWLAAGAVQLDGERWTPARRGRVRILRDGEHTQIAVPGSTGQRLEVELTAPASATMDWDYASPDGRGRAVEHCSVADGALSLDGRRWEVTGRVSVEHGRPAA